MQAPIWRKLLVFRLLIIVTFALFVSYGYMLLIDGMFKSLPRWLQNICVIPAVFPFISLIVLIIKGITDLAVHFVPEGKVKRLLVGKDLTSHELASDFQENGYWIAIAPLVVWAGLISIVIVGAVFIAGTTVIGAFFSSVFSGWPIWSVVITVLLVLVLLKG